MSIISVEKEYSAVTGTIVPNGINSYMDNVIYRTNLSYDDKFTKSNISKLVIYLGGSGSTDTFLSGELLKSLTSEGYAVFNILPPVLKRTGESIWQGNYGNQNDPIFLGFFVADSFTVYNAVKLSSSLGLNPNTEIALLGHSRGGSAILSYLSGLSLDKTIPVNIKGCFVNGSSVGGMSENPPAWVNLERTIRTVGNVIKWSNIISSKINRIIYYGDKDSFMPPEAWNKVVYGMLEPSDLDNPNLYFIVGKDKTHNWMNSSAANAAEVTKYIKEVIFNE